MKITPETYLNAIRTRDRVMLECLRDQFFPMVLKLVVNNSGTEEDAEDLFSEALVVILEQARDPRFEIRNSFGTYLNAICKNLWLKQLRRKKIKIKKLAVLEKLKGYEEESFQSAIEKTEKAALYREKLKLLNKRDQHILYLFYQEKKSYEEIAKTLNINSPAYAKKLKFKAQQKLIQLVKKDPRFEELKS